MDLPVVVQVRPYLIDDGGDVEVVKVEDGIVSLKLQVKHVWNCLTHCLTH
jgi:hypothetical protein